MFDFVSNNTILFVTPECYRIDEDGYVEQLLTDVTYLKLFHPETIENNLETDILGRAELEYLKDNDLKAYVSLVYSNSLETYINTTVNDKKSSFLNFRFSDQK